MLPTVEKRNWKIIYNDYSGIKAKAIDLVSRELGAHLNRDSGVFTLHVLPCIKTEEVPDCNVVVIGEYDDNAIIRKYVKKEEIPQDGYVVKVVENPENSILKIAVITGDTPAAVFYGAVDFVDDFFVHTTPMHGGLKMANEIFNHRDLKNYESISAPKFKTRSIFTWGQPILDYRNYIENMARLKFNQIIIWNDIIPLNANDVVDYAHEFGIEIIWGYAWGWRRRCADPEYLKQIMSDLPALKQRVIDEYVEKYSKIKGDGIYFQSFTELREEKIGGKVIAETVMEFVNDTADAMLKIKPDLHIHFGLHATSVREKMEYIAKVDPRIEILWEDCGSFPYNYDPSAVNETFFEETCSYTDDLINLREVNPLGLVYKGMMTMDWERFESQAGPYVMGMESAEIIKHDEEMMQPIWKMFQAEWMRYGKYAYDITNRVLEQTGGNVNMCQAGTLSGPIRYPLAMAAQLFWDPTIDYEVLVERVAKRHCVKMA